MANAASAVQSCNKGLVEARSKLRVESVRKAWDGVSMSTNSVASVAELEVIKQWLKKTARLGLRQARLNLSALTKSSSLLKPLLIFFKSSICYTVLDRSPWQTIYYK